MNTKHGKDTRSVRAALLTIAKHTPRTIFILVVSAYLSA